MKIGGKKLEALARGEVILPRPDKTSSIRLTVQAFPLGAEEEAERLFPAPVPPIRFAEGKRGKPLRDPRTNEVVKIRDLKDPDFVAKERASNRRQMMYLVAKGLESDPDFEWDVDPDLKESDPNAWADALFHECKSAGLSTGDLGLILDKIRELGNLTGKDIDEAVESFLSEAEAV